MPVNTLIYFALVAILLYLAESYFGKVNFLTFVTVLFTMPLATYMVSTFTFPIRLWLTSVCGYIFRVAGVPVEVAGNTFIYEGTDFTVDSACMGLNMLISSFIIGVMLFGFYQKKSGKEMPVWAVLAYLLLILALNIFSNLVRMMLLLIFQVFPDSMMHDTIGIICLLVQVVLPAWLVCRFWVYRSRSNLMQSVVQNPVQTRLYFDRNITTSFQRRYLVQLFCCVLLWVVALRVAEKKSENIIAASPAIFAEYTAIPHSKGVLQLENDVSLVYIKRIRWFCDTEHNPMICWSGSGYRISQVSETVLDGLTIYTGILQRDADRLYTAWWYSNGLTMTNSQFRWRWDMLTGAPAYSLLNVTTDNHEALKSEIVKICEGGTSFAR
jgi:exosortase N